jgi:DNA-binding NarL/FixJ family response regulator
VRIAVADDSALIRDGLERLLPAHGHEITATVADAESLLRSIDTMRPDVALIDIRMPPDYATEGIVAATTIREQFPDVGVLVLSQHIDVDYALTVIRQNPDRTGYLLKDRITNIEILLDAIDRVSHGNTVIDSELVALLLRRPATNSRLDDLTARERQVLALIAEGLTDRGVGESLWLTPKTVETHVRHILAKLNLPADTNHNRRVLAVLEYLRAEAAHPS